MQHFLRAELLMRNHMYSAAEAEYRQALGVDPQNGMFHTMLANCFRLQEKNDFALQEALQGVHFAPDTSGSHHMMALVQLAFEDYTQAELAIQEAIRLNPTNADHYYALALILANQKKPEAALNILDQAQQFDPLDEDMANLRARLLTQLGRREEAHFVSQAILQRNPENSQSHANQGWAYLHEGKAQRSMEHFREALRLNPNAEWARIGIIEAMKARNPLYNVLLRAMLWLNRFQGRQLAIGFFIGWVVLNYLRSLGDEVSLLGTIGWVGMISYIAFAVLTWTAPNLFNLILRLDSLGRLALSPVQITASNWLLGCLFLSAGAFTVGLVTAGGDLTNPYSSLALVSLAMILPISGTFAHELPRGLILYTAGLVVLGGIIFLTELGGGASGDWGFLFIIGLVLFTWVARLRYND